MGVTDGNRNRASASMLQTRIILLSATPRAPQRNNDKKLSLLTTRDYMR